MDIRELRNFVYIARLQSLSRAAEELRIAQPALSRQIRKLEGELGVKLLRRHARGVEVTPAGSIVLKRAEFLIQTLRQIKDEVSADTALVTGHVAIAVPPAAGGIIMPHLIKALAQSHPEISVHVVEAIGGALQELAVSGKADLIVVHNPLPSPALRIIPLVQEAMFVVSPPGSQSGRRSIAIKELLRLPLILPSYPHYSRLILEQMAARHGIQLNVVMEADGAALTRNLIAAGLGHGVMTLPPVQKQSERGELVAVPISGRNLHSTLALTFRRDAGLSAAGHVAVEAIKKTVADLVARREWPGALRLAANSD
ncbi:MAG TPA: LysR family transcriptional regulator [Pseudolabrys sp.]|jgi:LysR family nitrogen assimilation transcriptional regulator|nr:LysR family transcriptional regulator [Pseudolabrys sp.]